jgi:hypothetical protein
VPAPTLRCRHGLPAGGAKFAAQRHSCTLPLPWHCHSRTPPHPRWAALGTLALHQRGPHSSRRAGAPLAPAFPGRESSPRLRRSRRAWLACRRLLHAFKVDTALSSLTRCAPALRRPSAGWTRVYRSARRGMQPRRRQLPPCLGTRPPQRAGTAATASVMRSRLSDSGLRSSGSAIGAHTLGLINGDAEAASSRPRRPASARPTADASPAHCRLLERSLAHLSHVASHVVRCRSRAAWERSCG